MRCEAWPGGPFAEREVLTDREPATPKAPLMVRLRLAMSGMSAVHPGPGPHRIHMIHRLSIGWLGAFLSVLEVRGLARRPSWIGTHWALVMGLSANGLLAIVSVAVAAILIAAAIRGAPAASAAGNVLGALFVLSGLINLLVLVGELNLLAFRLSNVVFGLVVGTALLFIDAYGRLGAHLPPGNPNHPPARLPHPRLDDRTPTQWIIDAAADRELAEAERAVARHRPATEQAAARARFASPTTAARPGSTDDHGCGARLPTTPMPASVATHRPSVGAPIRRASNHVRCTATHAFDPRDRDCDPALWGAATARRGP
jgi:hypothetical protein